MLRHYLSAADLSRPEAEALLERGLALKAEWKAGGHAELPLRGKTLALVFEKPSPVSYTHLDVYKRQVLAFPALTPMPPR